jgi:hypothetical protein
MGSQHAASSTPTVSISQSSSSSQTRSSVGTVGGFSTVAQEEPKMRQRSIHTGSPPPSTDPVGSVVHAVDDPRENEKDMFLGSWTRASVERLAVQRSGRRQAGAAILRRCLCGDQISATPWFGGPPRGSAAILSIGKC